MAELVVKLPQSELKTFESKVALLKSKGVDVKYDIAQRNKRQVKFTMHTPVEPERWDAICEGAHSG